MGVTATIEIYGVRESLRILGEIDSEARWAAIREIKAAGEPMLREARSRYPSEAPLEFWGKKGRLGYDPRKVQSGVQIQVGGRSKNPRAFAIVTLVQKNAGGALFDLAGMADDKWSKRNYTDPGKTFSKLLTKGYDEPQRGLWRSVREIRRLGNEALMEALEKVAARANRKLVA